MQALVPKQFIDSEIVNSTVAEPDPAAVLPDGSVGEVEWNPAHSHARNDRRIRTTTHRVYRRIVAGSSSTAPENDPINWFDESATNKWKWADNEANSSTVSTSPYVLRVKPGAISAIELFGLVNVDEVKIEMYNGINPVYGATLSTEELTGTDPHWALYFEAPRQGESIGIGNLPIYPDCEVEITLSSYDTENIQVGLIAFGNYENIGLSQFGFNLRYKNYSFYKTDEYGNSTIIKGKKAKDLVGQNWLHADEANGVEYSLRNLMDTGAVYVPSQDVQYRYLKTWGRITPTITADGPDKALVEITIEGLI